MRALWISITVIAFGALVWLQVDRSGPRTRDASPEGVRAAINALFDAWHQAAAEGDFDAYFGRMTDDAVFLGTDATERWVGAEFRDWSREYFDGEEAWTYYPRDRHIAFAPDGMTAWIDEILTHDRYGTLRGTGVALRDERTDAWSIAHYSLTFLVPNDVAREVVSTIERFEDEQAVPSDP